MKLAILIVYFVPDDKAPILDLHLRAIQSRTTGDFKIYGVAPRVSERVRRQLESSACLELVATEPIDAVGSKEHSHYLGKLCEHALAQGADRICTMDVDAFPICGGWNDRLEGHLSAGNQVAAIFRAENDDTALPHPSCCYFKADFFRRYRPEFLPSDQAIREAGFQEFLDQTGQKVDSGIGLGYVLWRHQLPWQKLLRSNRVNDHYLLAGVYDDTIFHLGAMSWTDRDFRKDRNNSWVLKLLDWTASRLNSKGLFSGQIAEVWKKINYLASRPLVLKTNRIFASIIEQLTADADTYIRRLRNG